MLYLHPPFHVIRGVSLLRDHADPLQWYYLPLSPRAVTVFDPVDGVAVPQLQLIKYRGLAGNGGFLNFDCHLALADTDEEADQLRADIARELRNREDLDDLPRLAPVPLVDGTVKLILLGRSSDAPPPDPDAPPTDPNAGLFELKIAQGAKPALYADNRATFSVALDQEALTVVETALQGEIAPVGVVYSLDFLALRPAYSVRIHADWDRVQKHLSESIGVDTVVFSSQIDTVVDELIESQAIVIEVDTFIPEGGDDSGILGRRDQAVNEMREMITQSFFEPSLEPMDPNKEDGWDRFASTTERLSRIGASGGMANLASFSYKKVDLTRIDRRRLDVRMNERSAVRRSIYPQGHLRGLYRILRDTDISLDRFVLPVNLDDPWFERRKVNVIPRADFTADAISSVSVQLDYGGASKSVVLEPGGTAQEVNWASILEDPDAGNGDRRMVQEVSARFQVKFGDVDGSERPRELESSPRVVTTGNFEVDPRELYSIERIPINALSFPWERYPHVEVRLRYEDPDNGIRMADSLLLDVNTTEAIWPVFRMDPSRQTVSYQLVYRAADHQDLEGPWVNTEDERIVIRDPVPRKRTLEVVPAVSWETTSRLFVDLSYEDRSNDIREEKSLEFSSEDPTPKNFVVDLEDPEQRLVRYKVTILMVDGRLIEVPTSSTLEKRIFLRADMRGHRTVAIRPEAVDFAVKKIREMRVEVRFEDVPAGLDLADEFRFDSTESRATFEYDYVNDANSAFRYRVRYLMTNGLSRSTDWQRADGDELVLNVA